MRQRFGAIVAPDLAPGLHYRLPWPFESHRIVEADLVRRVEFGFRSEPAAELGPRALARDRLTVGGPGNPVPNAIKATGLWFEQQSVPEEAFLLAGDGNLIDLRFSVQYRVQDPVAFAYRMAEPEALVRSLTLAALRGIVATEQHRCGLHHRARRDRAAGARTGAGASGRLWRRHRAAVRQPALRAPARRRCTTPSATSRARRRTSSGRSTAPARSRSRRSIRPKARPQRASRRRSASRRRAFCVPRATPRASASRSTPIAGRPS